MLFLTFFFNILNNSSFFDIFFTFTPLIFAIIIKSLFDNYFGLDKFMSYIMQKIFIKKNICKKK